MITSLQNQNIKRWQKLHKQKGRKLSGTFLVEGFHLIEEAYRSNWLIEEMIVAEDVDIPHWCEPYAPVVVTTQVMQHMTRTESPQGIAAVVRMQEVEVHVCDTVLLLDAIQDPGNLGTMIRTADAAGFDMVMIGERTTDVYNDKVVRATQGSLFHMPIRYVNLPERISVLQEDGFTIWASALTNAVSFHKAEASDKMGLIIGNEGAGISEEVLDSADKIVNIPIYGQAESLNASVAAGILMYALKS
ncbi:RNA methyltransferase [Barrientosiimonas marina]|uniref:TrmH family RNA methyltransferase n=1 Tax=Lentibacillus kimchii TaxID=1542911 RepID=A0ABW2USU1_9BACI